MDDAKIELIKLVCAIVFLLLQFWIVEPDNNMEARFWNAVLHVCHKLAYAFGSAALSAESHYYEAVGAY